MKAYLEDVLKVPNDHIRFLCDSQASRSAIIQSLYELQNDSRIQEGDPILIFYAGHGSELPAPHGWETGGAKIQTLISQDYDGEDIHALPDRTVGALIDGIAQKKGDNITVILDCCHSGSGTRADDREDPNHLVRTVELVDSISADLDRRVWEPEGTRGSAIPAGFARHGLKSHILLAACSANELAREEGRRGVFTKALLRLLRDTGPEQLTYAEVLKRMDGIPDQNPQCEGENRNRIVFDGKARTPGRVCYAVYCKADEYIMEAGSAHGIVEDAEFTLYEDQESLLKAPSLGVLIASTVKEFSTTMRLPLGAPNVSLARPAVALQTKAGRASDLVLYIRPDDASDVAALVQKIQETSPERIAIASEEGTADAQLGIVVEGNKVALNILDSRVTQFGLTEIPFRVNLAVDDIYPVIRAAALYCRHLNRKSIDDDINSKIVVEFFKLEKSQSDFDEAGRPHRNPVGSNLYQDGLINIMVNTKSIYGMRLVNQTSWDLFPNVFFFDNSDLSIASYYKVAPSGQFKVDAPLAANGGTLTIGYGSGGASPFSYYLREGQDVDVGFLKFFLTTQHVDFSQIEQPSPFGKARAMHHSERDIVQQPEKFDAWGSILIPVVQRRPSRT